MRSKNMLCLLGACTLTSGFLIGYFFSELGVIEVTFACSLMITSTSALCYIAITTSLDRLPCAESLDLQQLDKSVRVHIDEGATSLVPQDHYSSASTMRLLIEIGTDDVCVVARQFWDTQAAVRVLIVRHTKDGYSAEKRLCSCNEKTYAITQHLPARIRWRDRWWQAAPVSPGEVAALIEAAYTWDTRTSVVSR